MTGPDRSRADDGARGPVGTAAEAWELIVGYARQETLDPLRGLGRYIAFGVAGSVFVAVGGALIGLALLRALQTETDVFEGGWSFAPYLIVAAVLLAATGLVVRVITAGRDPEDR